MHRLLLILLLLPPLASAQLRSVGVETLPLGSTRNWSQPCWSPDGRTIFYTTSNFDGIWSYSLTDRKVERITSDRGSGFGFTVSPDGKRIAYRRTLSGALPGERLQEAVVKNLAEGTSSVLGSGRSVSLPAFIAESVVYSIDNRVQGVAAGVQPAGTVSVLGIEDTKIAVLRDGVRLLLDPLGNGSYVWPSLSPDGKRLVAYEMDRGTFVSGTDGSSPVRIGRRDAPSWTHDGKWLVYMADKDDGHVIRSSDIRYISPDGRTGGALTTTSRRLEMYPRCSPVDDRVVCCTQTGEILVITYREAGR